MSVSVGVGLAFVAMLCWGFGDFLIQKSTKKIGDWETLFVITLFGTVVLLPFVYRDIGGLFVNPDGGLLILISSGLILSIAALLTFEAFKRGKLSVLEPILSFEIPAAAVLAFIVLDDKISWLQIVVILTLMIGLGLLSFREKYISRRFFWKRAF